MDAKNQRGENHAAKSKNSLDINLDNVLELCTKRLDKLGLKMPEEKVAEFAPNEKKQMIARRYLLLYMNSSSQPKEVRLKRFLLYGDETPLYQPGCRLQTGRLTKHYATVIYEFLQEYEQNLPQIIKDSEKTPPIDLFPLFKMLDNQLSRDSWPLRECAIFALALCVQFECKAQPTDLLKSFAYALAKKHLLKEEDLFLFVKFAIEREADMKDATSEPPKKKLKRRGFGRGMRNLINQWYNSRDPIKLARNVVHQGGYFGWKHSDLIKLAHVKANASDSPLEAVLNFALFGMDKTVQEFGQKPGCAPVIQELEKHKLELAATSETLVDLITKHKLKVDELNGEIKLSLAAWKALVNNMSAQEVLKYMPRLWRLNIEDGTDLWKAAAAVLQEKGACVHPAEVLITKMNYLMALANNNHTFNSAYWLDKKPKATIVPRAPCPVITQALDRLIDSSLKAIQPAGVCVLVTVDLLHTAEPGSDLSKCAFTHSISPKVAAALTALCLSRYHKNFTLTALDANADGNVKTLSLLEAATIESVLEKFDEVKPMANAKLGAGIAWARERKLDFDAFVLITPSLKGWNWDPPNASPYSALKLYQEEMKKPNARFALCALANMTVNIAQPPRSIHMMDFAGFDANTMQVLNAFVSGEIN